MDKLKKVKDRLFDFEVVNVTPLEELNCTLYELIHRKTHAQLLHIANDDPENLFCLSFKTWPDSSNGVAHILEHTVLCGSNKYPVKDPFFSMNRRSLNTYMNALTGPDFTCYPAASQNKKDFYNLFEVYLDAVFNPLLKEESFNQEGHRLEFENSDDPKSPLQYKGVVFNEMKGANSSADTRLWKSLMARLFPDTPYRHDSGGDPADIPSLSYEGLKDFHKTYYHPSRCLYFSYGNFPLEEHLAFLEDKVFKNIERTDPLPKFPLQKRFEFPKVAHDEYPTTEHEDQSDKTSVAFGFVTCHILNQKEALALQLIDIALMGNDGAPLKQALLQSGLCKQTDLYLDIDYHEIPLVFVCKGCPKDAGEKIKDLILTTLKKIAEEGIAENIIDSAIHQLEFSRSEISGGSSPFGLTLFMRAALLKQQGGNPSDGLRIHSLFEELRQDLKNPTYLKELIHRHILDNSHSLLLSMHPNPTMSQKEEQSEKEILSSIKDKLSEKDIEQLVKKAEHLTTFQEDQENESIDVLPKVGLKDIAKSPQDYPLNSEEVGPITLFFHPTFTNQIAYLDLIFDLPDLNQEELMDIRLFCTLLSEVGCGGRNYQENLQFIQENTGGISASLSLHNNINDANQMSPTIGIKVKALYRKIDNVLQLLNDIILTPDFTDQARLKELLMQLLNGLENSLQQQPMRYALNLASSSSSLGCQISYLWNGLPYVNHVRQCAQDIEGLSKRFEALKTRFLGQQGAHLVVSCDQKFYDILKDKVAEKLKEVSSRPFKPFNPKWDYKRTESQARTIAANVAFTGIAMPCVSYNHPDTASLTLASFLFENKVLHKRIREQGGAYGSGASHNPTSAIYTFYTYRDPHLASSLQAIEEAVKDITNGQFDIQDLEEAKLGVIQSLDTPINPGSRAISAYFWWRSGKTLAHRIKYRKDILEKTPQQISKAVDDNIFKKLNHMTIASFAGKELLEKENHLLKDSGKEPLPIYSLMD
ncbi:MAG: insulinase family protein [Parachlamydiales bacterium]|nr:insulinase family protein [Parachlamydiales bacterium]